MLHRGILGLALACFLAASAQAEYTFRPLSSGNGIGTVNGIVKGDGAGNPSQAVAGTDYVSPTLSSGRIFIGSVGNLATGVTMGGDCTIVAAGTITCAKSNGSAFGSMAFQSASSVAITGGALNGTLGATTPAALTATTGTFNASPFTYSVASGDAIFNLYSPAANQAALNIGTSSINRWLVLVDPSTGRSFNLIEDHTGVGGVSANHLVVLPGGETRLNNAGGAFKSGATNIASTTNCLHGDGSTLATITGGSSGGCLLIANNLSDLNSASTARTNLGLGTMATQNASSVAITGGSLNGTLGGTTPNTIAGTTGNFSSDVIVGNASGTNTFSVNGAASGSGTGNQIKGLEGSVSNWALGSYSAVLGGAHDNTPTLASTGAIRFAPSSITKVTIDSAGNLGIGTVPSAQLHNTGSVLLGSSGGTFKSGSTGIGGVSGCLASDGSSPANITAGPCGTGLPGGGTVGQAVLNTASGTGNWFTQQFYNISANASTDCTGAVGTALSTVIGSNTNALIPPGCTVKVSADDTIGVTKTLLVQCGATVSIDTTKTLTINARFIDPGPCSLFTVAGTGKVQGIRDVRPEWFNCDTGTPNYEPCITRAIYSAEHAASSAGDTFRISFQCSTYSYRATLTFTPTSAIPWRGKGCADGSTVLESHSTFTGTSGVVVTNGSDTSVHWIFEGIEFVNKTAGSGATVGITIGGTTAAQIMGGYSRSSFKNGHVSGYATNILQQNARMINYDNFSSWPNDNSGGIVSSPVGWKLTANLNGFVGDTDWINGSQCTSKNNNVTFTGSTSGSTTLTVSAISAGAITIGMKIVTAVPGAPTVLAQLTGSPGSTGTYQLGQSTTVGSTSMLGVYGTGDCVVMQDDGTNAIHISGIGFEAPFTCYYGATCWKVVITAPGTIFDDFWVSPRVQAESYGNGRALEVTASGSGTLWRNFNMNGIYFAGYGWEKNIYMLNNTSAAAKDLQANNNYFAGTTFEAIDVRGTGGSNCLGITANGNILREPSLDGLANSGIYLENCGSSTANSNTMEGTVGVVRANIVKFNSGGNYLTCVGNNSGGITTASGTSNVCVNSAGAAQFANGSNQ